jgi:ABC-type lipoprotein export system ATPase subunit
VLRDGQGIGVRAHRLCKAFDGGLVQALVDVDLEVQAGERVAITGPVGSGKSTLLALIAMLDQPDSGALELDGELVETVRNPESWRAECLGIVFQLHYLLPYLTAAENVMLPLIAGGGPIRQHRARAHELLESLELGHRAGMLACKLSGGERQLTAVARALVNDPRLVLADEPTGSVDSGMGARVLEILTEWWSGRASTLILATHDAQVAAWSDRVVRMRDGRVLAEA